MSPQLAPRPRLLATSLVASPSSCGGAGASSAPEAGFTDLDRLLSAASVARGSKSNKDGPSRRGEDHSELSALLSSRPENGAMFDCHVSVRRWSALALGWLCGGQVRLLETCARLLGDGGGRGRNVRRNDLVEE